MQYANSNILRCPRIPDGFSSANLQVTSRLNLDESERMPGFFFKLTLKTYFFTQYPEISLTLNIFKTFQANSCFEKALKHYFS